MSTRSSANKGLAYLAQKAYRIFNRQWPRSQNYYLAKETVENTIEVEQCSLIACNVPIVFMYYRGSASST